MNFVFIIDTSLSMSQTYNNISFFDIAKSSIRKFIFDREINNCKLNRNKSDKYFLITLNQNIDENFLYNWSTTTDHFLCQLNALKISYDFTNIDYAIRKGFQMINFIKKIGIEKHVYGRLFSKIQNSYLILITDGGNLSTNEKVITTNDHSILSLKDKSDFILDNYPNLYKELYRWDHSLFAFVLTDKNNDFESFKVLDKICKNVGGKIITVDNPNSLNDKLNDLNNKSFLNNRVYINFNINKLKKKNIITYLEYKGNIDKMNEKWPFPDELIINKDMTFLPPKNALPIYELGNYKYNSLLKPEYYDEYEIKDKKFIMNILTDGDCWNNLNLSDFLCNYKTSVTIDILVSDLKDKKILKKPFAIINIIFSKELIDHMNETIHNKDNKAFNKFFIDFQSYYIGNSKNFLKNNNICNYIKSAKFLNLPYYYTEFFSLINEYKEKKIMDIDIQFNLEKYFSSIPFYYIRYAINFLEKNKIKKLLEKDREIFNNIIQENFNKKVISEIDKLSQFENKQVLRINKLFSENKKSHLEKKANCCFKEEIYKNQNNYHILNKSDENQEDNEYLNFIEKTFKIDKLSNLNNNLYESNYGYKNGYNFIRNGEFEHECDIEIMGDYRDYYYKNQHSKSYLIPEIEIRYLIKDFIFGNEFLERKIAYSSKNGTNSGFMGAETIKDESILHYIYEEDNDIYPNSLNNKNENKINNINIESTSEQNDNQSKKINSEQNKGKEEKINNNHFINNKRNRDNSMDNIHLINDKINLNDSFSTEYTQTLNVDDNFSESDGIDNLMLDEFSENKYISKMNSSLIEEFKESINLENNDQKEGMKINVKYHISNEKLTKWKFQKKIKNFSQELINSIHNDENNIIKTINKIIEQKSNATDKKMIYNFIEKIYSLCQSYGVNSLIQVQIQNLMKNYA